MLPINHRTLLTPAAVVCTEQEFNSLVVFVSLVVPRKDVRTTFYQYVCHESNLTLDDAMNMRNSVTGAKPYWAAMKAKNFETNKL